MVCLLSAFLSIDLAYYNCSIRYTRNVAESLTNFQCRRLGQFRYHVLSEPGVIRRQLLKWIIAEWESDHALGPDEPWTVEWMERLPLMRFSLQRVRLVDIRPRPDLMSYQKPGYSFLEELEDRVREREEAIGRGYSIEPLLVDGANMELMDGYVRYTLLRRHREPTTYAYAGIARTAGRAAVKGRRVNG